MIPSVLTRSGEWIQLLDTKKNRYRIDDIAHALSHLCRFTGHTNQFYSVAQHSVLASVASKTNPMEALLHDAAEAYLGDVSSPLKSVMRDYQRIERRFETSLFHALGVAYPMPREVDEIDRVLLATEIRDLMLPHPNHWSHVRGVVPLEDKIAPWRADIAYARFLDRYYSLLEGR